MKSIYIYLYITAEFSTPRIPTKTSAIESLFRISLNAASFFSSGLLAGKVLPEAPSEWMGGRARNKDRARNIGRARNKGRGRGRSKGRGCKPVL